MPTHKSNDYKLSADLTAHVTFCEHPAFLGHKSLTNRRPSRLVPRTHVPSPRSGAGIISGSAGE